MQLRVPDHYKQFKCTADKCRKNCCAGGWDIEVDPDTLDVFKQSPDEKKLLASVKKKGGDFYFKTSKQGCVWLDEKKLCRLYKEYGADHQAPVCRQFPRFSEYYGEIKETGLGLGCEEAARIVFSCRKRPETETSKISEEMYKDPGFDPEMAEAVFEVRRMIFELLYRKEVPAGSRLEHILKICDDFQDILNNADSPLMPEVKKIAAAYRDVCAEPALDNGSPHVFKDISDAVLCVFEELPDIRKDLDKMLSRIRKFTDRLSGEKLKELLTEFDRYIEKEERVHEYEAFLWYLVYRYFAKTVYDGDSALKGRLFVLFFFFLKLADASLWKEKGKKFTFSDRVENALVFSREVEYSEDNMEQIYEMFLFDEELDAETLVGFL